MKIEIKKLSENDLNIFIDTLRLFEDVFEMKNFILPHSNYLEQLLSKKDFIVFVALKENQVVGALTSYILQQYYSQQPLAYIFDLAVKKEEQRKGIGKALMENHSAYCKQIGVEEIMVQADEPDAHALEFYRSTGGIPEKVVHFNYPLK